MITYTFQLSMGMTPMRDVGLEEFFETNLIQNLADLLKIDISKIRIMSVVAATKRKRRATGTPVDVLVCLFFIHIFNFYCFSDKVQF